MERDRKGENAFRKAKRKREKNGEKGDRLRRTRSR